MEFASIWSNNLKFVECRKPVSSFLIHNVSFSHTSRHLHPASGGGHNVAAHSSYTTVCNTPHCPLVARFGIAGESYRDILLQCVET